MAPPTVSACQSACGSGSTANPPSICIHSSSAALDSATAVTVASAGTNTGKESFTFTPGTIGSGNLQLTVPRYAYATAYSSTLMVTIVQGPAAHVLEATQRTKATREPGPRTLSGSYSSWLYRDTSPFSIRVAGSRRSELDPVACVQMRLATGDMDYPLCELVAETPADQPARSPLSPRGIGSRREYDIGYLEVCCVT
jgi:hypothetical protein